MVRLMYSGAITLLIYNVVLFCRLIISDVWSKKGDKSGKDECNDGVEKKNDGNSTEHTTKKSN